MAISSEYTQFIQVNAMDRHNVVNMSSQGYLQWYNHFHFYSHTTYVQQDSWDYNFKMLTKSGCGVCSSGTIHKAKHEFTTLN